MKNIKYYIIGIIIGFFLALGCNNSIMASGDDYFELGTQYNPMYVKIVN